MRRTCFSLLYVESDFGTRHHRQIIQSIVHPIEAINLIVASKSQPVDLDNSTDVEVKEKLAIILFCGFGFPCFNAI